VTDRILAATVLFHKQTEVMLRDCWSSADLAHEPVDALLSHAVPDQSGTRRIVIEQRAGEDAVLLDGAAEARRARELEAEVARLRAGDWSHVTEVLPAPTPVSGFRRSDDGVVRLGVTEIGEALAHPADPQEDSQ